MIDFGVEEHRIRNEKEFGVYLDFICEGVKGHPVFGIGDRLLDWRYNKDDWGKLMMWIGWEMEVEQLTDEIDYLQGKEINLSDDSLNMVSV